MSNNDDEKGLHLNLPNGEVVLTRRHFLYGTLGAGALAAAAAGSKILGNDTPDAPEIPTLDVAKDAVFSHEDCTEVEADYLVRLAGDFKLPYGTLVWMNDNNWAACLLPTETPSPLTQVGLLSLTTGDTHLILNGAVGVGEGFEIYDVRATSAGAIWTEANIFENRWRIYGAALDTEMTLIGAVMLEEGDDTIETPSIAAVGNYAFWQTMPQAGSDDARRGPAFIKRVTFGASTSEVMLEAKGRFGAPLYACEDAIVCAPRHDDNSSFFRLVHMDAASGEIDDEITLPQSMQPNQLGYGPTGFTFCFDAIYDNEYGIANLGTYTPAASHEPNNYSDLEWFRFARTPLGSPAWCGTDYLLVKSTRAVCAIDLEQRRYCAIDIADGSTDWGDYLITSGMHDTFATSMQIDYTDTYGTIAHHTQVRLWQAVPAEERLSTDEILVRQQSGQEAPTSSEDADMGPSTNREGNESANESDNSQGSE